MSNTNVYNKTIEESDYGIDDTFQHIDNMRGVLSGAPYGWGSEYRRWEYGMVLSVLRANNVETVLDVGGGSSMFAAAAMWMDMKVTVVDPHDYSDWFIEHGQRIGKPIHFIRDDFMNFNPEPLSEKIFDAVVCISVLEHVPDDTAFFLKLLSHVKPGGIMMMTTDFHPSGNIIVGGHLRTYNKERLVELRKLARTEGFTPYGGKSDYDTFNPVIDGGYSFASLTLKKSKND